ncbi:MAG: hypothetical protein WBV31_11865 [Terriglobales bacterium]
MTSDSRWARSPSMRPGFGTVMEWLMPLGVMFVTLLGTVLVSVSME